MMARLLDIYSWLVPPATAIAAVAMMNLVPIHLEGAPKPATHSSAAAAANYGDRILVADAVFGQPRTADFAKRKIKTVLKIRKPLRYGQFVWDEHGVPSGDIWIRIDLSTQILSIFRAGHEIGTAVIMYGADKKPTPIGQLHVLSKSVNHRSSLYEAAMPYTLRLTNEGVAIHGADVRPSAATHGCVSIPTAFAQRLFQQAKVGDPVTILPEKRLNLSNAGHRQTMVRT